MKTIADSCLTGFSRFPAVRGVRAVGGARGVAGKVETAPALVVVLAGRIPLAKGRIIRLDRMSRVTGISIARGSVWVTETPGTRDVVAGAGEFVRIGGGWPVVVQALTEAVVEFSREGES